ncbi:MAG: aspartate kinase [Bacteroidota bacterium]
MRVFKFGGASVKDAAAVRNVAEIMKRFPGPDAIVVVSAMGKTTNDLEALADAFYYRKKDTEHIFDKILSYHYGILNALFPGKDHAVYRDIEESFGILEAEIEKEAALPYDQVYDQIVCMGELISSRIVSAYLNEAKVKNRWLDVRDVIRTDSTYREGKVNWELTEKLAREKLGEGITVTQGFLGGTPENYTTTLGREGSDYSAAILAYCTDADDVTIWKDVPGVLNADPKWFDDTRLIEQLSYQDAIELSYYGATVIHPKTLKPLQNKKIPLYVRSFLDPGKMGTVISEQQLQLPIPCFIFKVNQVLISISPKDFSFIVEENLSDIFRLFSQQGIKINTMQNSALSFSVCVENDLRKLPQLIETLRKKFRVLYNDQVELVTIRYYDQATIDRVTAGKNILLEVKSRYTIQMAMKNA